MRLHKTGHAIADTVSDLIGELPNDEYAIAYGILRGSAEHLRSHRHWFEIDKGFWGAQHFDGQYRLSYRGTQPIFNGDIGNAGIYEFELHPWKSFGEYDLICPPTEYVCKFFDMDGISWLFQAIKQAGKDYKIRHKGDPAQVDWNAVSKVITFNSTIAIEALRRGIPVISDPVHSTIGSYTAAINCIDNYDRTPIMDFISAHQFKLDDKEKICHLIKYYLSMQDGIHGRQ